MCTTGMPYGSVTSHTDPDSGIPDLVPIRDLWIHPGSAQASTV